MSDKRSNVITDGEKLALLESCSLPTIHIVGDSIPEAYWKAIDAVWHQGQAMRTEYDLKDPAGSYLHPPSRDARVLIEVTNPFAQPRYPIISHCEIGTYIAEIMGFKDFMVLSMEVLLDAIKQQNGIIDSSFWPYSYHQRLFAHPDIDGGLVNQIAIAIDRLAETPYTRRAVCTTAVPNVDPFLKEDVPCLRELMLRCVETPDKSAWILNATTTWRSRDLYKAWGDNVIALTFLLQTIAHELSEKIDKPVYVGSYADFSASLHIYGQNFGAVGGDEAKGLSSFFTAFPTAESFVARSLDSDMASYMLVLPQLQELLTPEKIKEWKIPTDSIAQLAKLYQNIEDGTFTA